MKLNDKLLLDANEAHRLANMLYARVSKIESDDERLDNSRAQNLVMLVDDIREAITDYKESLVL